MTGGVKIYRYRVGGRISQEIKEKDRKNWGKGNGMEKEGTDIRHQNRGWGT